MIRSNESMVHSQLTLLKEIFQKDGYQENFIGSCLMLLLNKIDILKEKVPTTGKEPCN